MYSYKVEKGSRYNHCVVYCDKTVMPFGAIFCRQSDNEGLVKAAVEAMNKAKENSEAYVLIHGARNVYRVTICADSEEYQRDYGTIVPIDFAHCFEER